MPSRSSKRSYRSRRNRDWSKRTERAYVQRAPHRFPPLHDVEGECRLCRSAVPPSKNGAARRWHNGKNGEPDCWNSYRLMTRHKLAKQTLARQRGNACEKCGVKAKTRSSAWLHLDHIVPLKDGIEEGRDPLTLFAPSNLQLLCPVCHTEKTSMEATARAARRKLAKEAA